MNIHFAKSATPAFGMTKPLGNVREGYNAMIADKNVKGAKASEMALNTSDAVQRASRGDQSVGQQLNVVI